MLPALDPHPAELHPLPPDAAPAWLAPPHLIATSTTGRTAAAGDYPFWLDRRGGGAIYGYQRSQGREVELFDRLQRL